MSRKTILLLLIAIFTFGIYSITIKAPFLFDDELHIVKNPDIKDINKIGSRLIYPYKKNQENIYRNDPFRPIVFLTFAINYHFSGLNPTGYHIFNILLHIMNAFLVFMLAKLLFKKDFELSHKTTADAATLDLYAFFTAAMFALHPINNEVVSNICRRSGGLATFFFLISFIAIINVFEGRKNLYILALSSFLIALFSKEIAITFPVIILLYDYIFLSDMKFANMKVRLKKHLPFWIMLFGYMLFRFSYLGSMKTVAFDASIKWTRFTYLITQFNVVANYIIKIIFPHNFAIEHLVIPTKSIDMTVIGSFVFFVVFLGIGFYNYRKKGDIYRIYLFGAIMYLITIAPTSSFIPLIIGMADRRVYLPGIGIYIIAVYMFCKVAKIRLSDKFKLADSIIPIIIYLLYVLMLMYFTVMEGNRYRDPVAMLNSIIDKYPEHTRARNNLGCIYANNGRYSEALKEFTTAIEISPTYIDPYNNMGLLYRDLKQYEKASRIFTEALKLDPDNPNIYLNFGNIFYDIEKYDEALDMYEKSMKYNSNNPSIYQSIGLLYQKQKKYDKAISAFNKAIDIDTSYIDAYYGLGNLFAEIGDNKKAIEYLTKAVGIAPDRTEIINNLGSIYYKIKDYDQAIEIFNSIIKLDPDYYKPYFNLGLIYYKQERYKLAEKMYGKAIKANTKYINARINLGQLFVNTERINEAIKEFRTILKIDPDNVFAIQRLKQLEK